MAWNEPGGSGNKDPWGSRSPEQGPNLDEVIRRLQRKFGGLFGGGGGPSGGNKISPLSGFVLIIGALVLLWIFSGFYSLKDSQRGVVLEFGAYKETTTPGLHWYPRFIDTVQKVDIEQSRSAELGDTEKSLMLTKDGNIINVRFAIKYKVSDPRDYLFNVRNPEEALNQAMESAMRETVGKNDMDFIIDGGRSAVKDQAQTLIQAILDKYKMGLTVTSLDLQAPQAPQPVQSAFADAIKAREDAQRLKSEAEAYASDILPKARGEAAHIQEDANAYKDKVILQAKGETERFLQVLAEYKKAPGVTRDRLYLDSMESVLSKSSKVLVDTRNNNLLYLPLDKITGRSTPATTTTAPAAPAVTEKTPAPGSEAAKTAAPVELRPHEDLLKREVR